MHVLWQDHLYTAEILSLWGRVIGFFLLDGVRIRQQSTLQWFQHVLCIGLLVRAASRKPNIGFAMEKKSRYALTLQGLVFLVTCFLWHSGASVPQSTTILYKTTESVAAQIICPFSVYFMLSVKCLQTTNQLHTMWTVLNGVSGHRKKATRETLTITVTVRKPTCVELTHHAK